MMLFSANLHMHQMVPNCIDTDKQLCFTDCRYWCPYTVWYASNFKGDMYSDVLDI